MNETRPTDAAIPPACATDNSCGPDNRYGCNQTTFGTSATLPELGVSGSVRTPWARFAVLAALVAAAYFLIVGIFTAVVPSPFFDRKLSVDIWNVASLVIPAFLFGLLAATYLVPWPSACRVGGRAGAGGALSFLAAGCPVCNKLVVLAIGTTGAVEYFRPLQPVLGAVSVLLLGIALRARWQTRQLPPIAPGGPLLAISHDARAVEQS